MAATPTDITQRIAALSEPAPAAEAPAPEAPTEAPEAAPQPSESSQPERAQDEPGEAVEATEGATDAPADTAPTDGDEDVVGVGNISELAEYLGVEASDLYELSIPISEGDKTTDMSLGELKDSVAKARKLEAERADFESARQQFQEETTARQAAIEASAREALGLAELAEKRLTEDLESIDWAGLRENDPSEWSARRQEMSERKAQIEQMKGEIRSRWERTNAEQQQEIEQHRQTYLKREREALLQAIPAWRDEAVAKTEMSALRSYLSRSGFSDDDINGAADHRVILLAEKARAYDEQQRKVETAKKRVVKIGRRTVRPGNARGNKTAREDHDASLRKSLKDSGRIEDAAALIGTRLRG